MEPRPQEPSDQPIVRALATVRTAAYVLRDLDFGALDQLDQNAVAAWEASLVDARATLLRFLARRGGEELEVPPRGQLDRYDLPRVENHVRGISKALLSEFERIDATPGSVGQISTSIILGLLYSLRSIEQFILWQEPERRAQRPRSHVRRPSRVAEPPSAVPPAPETHAALPAPGETETPPPLLFEDSAEPAPAPEPPAPPPPPEPAPPERVPPRPAPAPPSPPPPRRRDVDLSRFYERADEYGGALRLAPLSVFQGCARGPAFAKRERCLDATCVRAIPGGAAFAVADGTESSIGARAAAVVATTTFCELLALAKEEPRDVRGAIVAAAEGARRQLERLLESLIESADDSDAMRLLRGGLPAHTVRRILEHTMVPDPKLRHVTPALAVSFAGGVVVQLPHETYEMTVLSIGGAAVERKRRGHLSEVLLPVEGGARFAPGAAIPWQPSSIAVCGPVRLSPGDMALVGSSALRRGYEGAALDKLSLLCSKLAQLASPHEDHALQVLRDAASAADRFEALEEKRARSRSQQTRRYRLFADDLSMVLLTVAPRVRSGGMGVPSGSPILPP